MLNNDALFYVYIYNIIYINIYAYIFCCYLWMCSFNFCIFCLLYCFRIIINTERKRVRELIFYWNTYKMKKRRKFSSSLLLICIDDVWCTWLVIFFRKKKWKEIKRWEIMIFRFFSSFLLYSIDVKFIFVSLHFFAHFKKQTHTYL